MAPTLARLMIDQLPPLDPVDLIMPIPLHSERLREREFNQSLLLADQIGQHLHCPVSYTNLLRIAPSPPQTTLSRKDRLRNLRKAFSLRHPDAVVKKRILLIDDVYTTGTTVNECAKTLRKAGSGDVYVLTLARTVESNLIPDRTAVAATDRAADSRRRLSARRRGARGCAPATDTARSWPHHDPTLPHTATPWVIVLAGCPSYGASNDG